MQADVADVGRCQIGQGARHAVEERLAADESGVAVAQGRRKKMLASPEPDLKPEIAKRRGKESRRVDRVGNVDAESRQERSDEFALVGRERLAAPPTVQRRPMAPIRRRLRLSPQTSILATVELRRYAESAIRSSASRS